MQFDWLNFIIGLLVGVGTEFFGWWCLARFVVPRLRFSPSISKIYVADGDRQSAQYRIKLENAGRRSIIDMELTAKLVIKGIGRVRSTYQTGYIPLRPNGDLQYRIARLRPPQPARGKFRHIIHLYVNSGVVFMNEDILPHDILKKREEGTLTLEDILGLGEGTYLEIQAFGYDEFSGARKYFVSKRYDLSDILEGPFRKYDLTVKSAV